MEHSLNLDLPFIMPAQAQKHITHNEALRLLDAIVQLSVIDSDRTAPPPSPADGARHIVSPGATGEWSGKDGTIAHWQDGAWRFVSPKPGWIAWVQDEGRLVARTDAGWVAAAAQGGDGAAMVGINATADQTNRLAVSSPATLLNHEGSGHQLKINKSELSDTASLLFQTGFSGRAEMGTAGSDDFVFKVSPDGAQWTDAMTIDRTSGRVRLPHTPLRQQLDGPRTYHVRPDGNDANDGRSDNPGGAFATIQRAIDTVAALDLGIHDVTIQIAEGIYTGPVELKSLVGAGAVTLRGNPATPGAVHIARTGIATCIRCANTIGDWRLDGLRLSTNPASGSAHAISALGPTTTLRYRNIDFGPAGRQVAIEAGAYVAQTGPCVISGGGLNHVFARVGALFDSNGAGSTRFEGAGLSASFATFALCATGAVIYQPNLSYIDATGVTGTRYSVSRNGVIQIPGSAGASYFPGALAGSAETGGQYA